MSEALSTQAAPLAVLEAVSEPAGPELDGSLKIEPDKDQAKNGDNADNEDGSESDGEGDDDEVAGGTSVKVKKKKKKKSKRKKKSAAVQSDPPRVGISKFFPDGQYPVGEIKEYTGECVHHCFFFLKMSNPS